MLDILRILGENPRATPAEIAAMVGRRGSYWFRHRVKDSEMREVES